MSVDIPDYGYNSSSNSHTNSIVWETVVKILDQNKHLSPNIFELGCGNGSTADMLSKLDYDVTGVDASETGVKIANTEFPHLKISVGNAYDDLESKYGKFPIVISLDVVEHCYYPREFAKTFYELVDDAGIGIISTPYHGYLKNLALAITGRMDFHFSPLWEGGHIKFFSMNTLGELLRDVGFKEVEFLRVGRIPPLAMSLVAVVKK